jgi:hypothetical protein
MPTSYACQSRILRCARSTFKNSSHCAKSDEKVLAPERPRVSAARMYVSRYMRNCAFGGIPRSAGEAASNRQSQNTGGVARS